MPDARVVLRTEGPAVYGVNLPIVELLRTRDESDCYRASGPRPLRDDWDIAEATRRLASRPGPAPSSPPSSISAASPDSATCGPTNSVFCAGTTRGHRWKTSTYQRCLNSGQGRYGIPPLFPGQCR